MTKTADDEKRKNQIWKLAAGLPGLDPRALRDLKERLNLLEGCDLEREESFWDRVIRFAAIHEDLGRLRGALRALAEHLRRGGTLRLGPAEGFRLSTAAGSLRSAGDDPLWLVVVPVWRLAQLDRLELDARDPVLRRLLVTLDPGLSPGQLEGIAQGLVDAACQVEERLPGFLPHG